MSFFNIFLGSDVENDVRDIQFVEAVNSGNIGYYGMSCFFPGRDSCVKHFDILIAELFRLPGG